MNVEEEENLNKSSLIYVGKKSFRVIKDKGSYYNFVTTNLFKRLDLKPKYLKNLITLYTCLYEPFKKRKAKELEFKLDKQQFKEVFYVMPKRKDITVILGRIFLQNKKSSTDIKPLRTPEEAIRILCEEKKDGVKEYLCEIYTQKNKQVTVVPFKIPQAMKNVEEEIRRLMEKGYIRESKSTQLNNVRPLIKTDGKIR